MNIINIKETQQKLLTKFGKLILCVLSKCEM